MEAKQFGQFIAGIRKEKKMTQAELAQQIHVTDKAVSRWERGLGFPDIQTLEPLAQALGITVLELMRSEKKETEEQDQQPEERRYTQGEVAEMLQNAGDISRQHCRDRVGCDYRDCVDDKAGKSWRSAGDRRYRSNRFCIAVVFFPEYRR